jgi:16S rRNA (guanine527-N7)-methyltransferase
MQVKITNNEFILIQNLLLEHKLNSIEIIDTFTKYVDILAVWQKNINLVSTQDLAKVWDRHIFNSLQLLPFVLKNSKINILDIGSGAGFPAIILAICNEDNSYFLVESNTKKASFLKFVVSILNLKNVIVLNKRLEDINDSDIKKIDIITARAVASLLDLVMLSNPLFKANNYALFLKGENYLSEIEEFTNSQLSSSFNIDILTIKNKKEVILKVLKP